MVTVLPSGKDTEPGLQAYVALCVRMLYRAAQLCASPQQQYSVHLKATDNVFP
jgi:hypothetical protein